MRRKIITLALLWMVSLVPVAADGYNPQLDRMRNQAEELLERRRWADAKQALKRLRSELDPVENRYDMEWVDYHLVRCVVELGTPDAEAMMLGYLEQYPAGLHSNRMQFMLASYLCDEGWLEDAETEIVKVKYKGLDAREKERYDVRLGYMRFLKGDYLTADEHFSRISKQSDYYPHALYYMSYIDYSTERYDEAKQGFEQLVNREPYRNIAPYYLVQIEYRNHNYDYVIEHGEYLLESASSATRDDLVRVVAESHFIKGDYAKAIHYLSSYPADKMGRQESYILGYSLYRMARYGDAVEPLKRVCERDDALTQNAAYHLGDSYLRTGDKSHAADAFALASVEGYDATIAEDALLNYGRLKYEMGGGRFNEAVNVLQSYLGRYPDSEHADEVKALLIAAYYNSKNYDAAYVAIKEHPNPDNEIRAALQKVAVFRAVDAFKEGDMDEAARLLDEAEQINISPKYNALVLYWQGEVAYARGDMATALECYNAYIRRAPKSEGEYAMAHYGLGYAHFQQKSMEEAAEAFDSFVKEYALRDNYMYDAHNRLGDARYALRDFTQARRAYNVVVASATVHRNYARYQLAMVDGIEKKTKSKIERLKSIVDDNQGDYVDDAWYELGRTYIAAERYSEGAATLQEFVDTDTTSPFYIAALSDLGLAYYNINRRDDARRCYEEVVAYDPQSSAALEAMRGIREIYVSEGRVDEYFAYAERSGVQSDMSSAARDSLTFAAAKTAYLEGELQSAREKLENYLDSFTKGYNRSEALFYLSDCYVQSQDNDSAMATMKELLQQGTTQYTERVLGVYAPMTFEHKMYEESAKAYRDLYDAATKEATRALSSEGYVEATLLCGDDEAVKRMADDLLAMDDATQWALRQSSLAKAHVLRREGKSAEANKLYGALAEDRASVEGAEAYYYLILDKFSSGDYAATEQMVYDFGTSGSMYWQAKAFLVLGDVLVKMDNSFQARATYQSIVDGYSPKDDGIVAEAKARIKALK
mgnify:FL=1